jgi:hypothetical protein
VNAHPVEVTLRCEAEESLAPPGEEQVTELEMDMRGGRLRALAYGPPGARDGGVVGVWSANDPKPAWVREWARRVGLL